MALITQNAPPTQRTITHTRIAETTRVIVPTGPLACTGAKLATARHEHEEAGEGARLTGRTRDDDGGGDGNGGSGVGGADSPLFFAAILLASLLPVIVIAALTADGSEKEKGGSGADVCW